MKDLLANFRVSKIYLILIITPMYPSLLSFQLVLIYLCYELCVTTVILWLFVIISIIFRILIMQAKHVKNAKVSIS